MITVQDIRGIIRDNCEFQENSKKVFFLNNFRLPELQTLKILTQKETRVTQIYVASPFQSFYSEKSYVKN